MVKPTSSRKKGTKKAHIFPRVSVILLGLILLFCMFAELLMTKDPSYLDLEHLSEAPNGEFLFGTDSLGRDLFSGIWYGGRISLAIGFLSTLIAAGIAILYGTVSGLASKQVDGLMMRLLEVFLSVPGLLLVLFLQAILGQANILSLSLVIGVTSWPSMAKVVRTEVQQLRNAEYILASTGMGCGFFHILFKHLIPGFFPSIGFMLVMTVRSAISWESTLSFMGMGLPLEVISWGSMLSLAEKALLTESWWIIVIPGVFLVTVLLCLTNVGNYLSQSTHRKESNL